MSASLAPPTLPLPLYVIGDAAVSSVARAAACYERFRTLVVTSATDAAKASKAGAGYPSISSILPLIASKQPFGRYWLSLEEAPLSSWCVDTYTGAVATALAVASAADGGELMTHALLAQMEELHARTAADTAAAIAAFETHPGFKGVPIFSDFMPALFTARSALRRLAEARLGALGSRLRVEGGGGVVVNAIVAIQSRGYLCSDLLRSASGAATLGITLETGVLPVFKAGCIPASASVSTMYTKEYSALDAEGKPIPEAICMHRSAREAIAGRSVIVTDDVVATGGSLCAAIELAQSQGAKVLAAVVVSAIRPLLPSAIAKIYALGVPLIVLVETE